jgi:polyamine oxidase
MSVVRSMFPNVTVPEPTDFFFPRWHSNPLFRGSYSNWPPSFYTEHLDNLRANVGRLYFAGEATSRKYFGAFCGLGGRYYLSEKRSSLVGRQDSCMAPTLKD